MTKTQPLLKRTLLTALLIGLTYRLDGAETMPSEWKSAPMNEIRAIWENKKLSDEEIVASLIRHLDQRITMSQYRGTKRKRPEPGHEYATLVGLIADRPYPAQPRGRPEAIHKAMESLGSQGAIKNKEEIKPLLDVALGLAGEPHDSEILAVLDNPKTPRELVVIGLEALERTRVPIRALPRLVALSDNSWSYIYHQGIGPQRPERVFPIRNAVLRCLRKLDIRADEIRIEDKEPDQWGNRFSSSTIKIDRRAMADKLREWTKSEDAKVREEALESAQKIGGADMKAILNESKKSK